MNSEIKEYIKSFGFDIDLEMDVYKDAIEYYQEREDMDSFITYISQLQNCGGYALEIPNCIWPVNNYTFEEKVLRIQELYPFVRLLSQGDLKEEEYVVLYRAEGMGHHFVKIKDTGEMIEKDGCSLPQKFKSWGKLESAPEAVFAVTKQEYRSEEMKKLPQCNTIIYLSQDAFEVIDDGYKEIVKKEAKRPETFAKKLKKSYENEERSFIYNNKKFNFKVNSEENDLIYVYDENELLGIAYADDEECIMELKDKNKVYGFQTDISKLIKKEQIDFQI